MGGIALAARAHLQPNQKVAIRPWPQVPVRYTDQMDQVRPAPPRGLSALLGASRWSALLELGARRVFPPKSPLFLQGDPGTHLLALTQGRAKVLHALPDGSAVLVAIRGHGDVIGEIAAWSSERRSGGWASGRRRTASVEAIDRCVAHRIEPAAFTRFLDEHTALGVFTEYLLDRLAQSVQYQASVSLQPARQRIAWLLMEAFELAGPELADRRRTPFSQAGIAAALGLSRSTVAEHLRQLRAAGVLAAGPRLVVIDASALRRVVSDREAGPDRSPRPLPGDPEHT